MIPGHPAAPHLTTVNSATSSCSGSSRPKNPFKHLGLWGGRYTSDYLAMGDTCFGSRWIMFAFLIPETALVILFAIGFVKEPRDALGGEWRSPRAAFRQAPALVFITVLLVIPILCFMFTSESYATREGLIQFSVLLLVPPLFIVRRVPAVNRAGPLRGSSPPTIVYPMRRQSSRC